MILDNIKNTQPITLSKNLTKALQWLTQNKEKLLNDGKYNIQGTDIYALVSTYETKSIKQKLWEAHKKYIDIHFLLKGSEKIAYANIMQLKVKKKYNNKDDYLLLSGKIAETITLGKDLFVVFFPQDAHIPGLISNKKSKVKKIVIKVKVK